MAGVLGTPSLATNLSHQPENMPSPSKPQSSRPPKVLIYGFKPWSDYPYNISEDVINVLSNQGFPSNIDLLTLETDYTAVNQELVPRVLTTDYDYILGLGSAFEFFYTDEVIGIEIKRYAEGGKFYLRGPEEYDAHTLIDLSKHEECDRVTTIQGFHVVDLFNDFMTHLASLKRQEKTKGLYLSEDGTGDFVCGYAATKMGLWADNTSFIHLHAPNPSSTSLEEKQSLVDYYASFVRNKVLSLPSIPQSKMTVSKPAPE